MAFVLAGIIAPAALASACAILPRNIIGMLRYDQRREGGLEVGDEAPDVRLAALDGAKIHIRDSMGGKPLVLIFGSYT